MTHRVRGALPRLFALGVASALVLACAVTALAAQEATGKLEGSVTDQSGAPVASAQVTLVGTAFGALTSERGYYFMNNVPAGVYTVRAKFIGYTASEITGVRILGGQTITTNIKLTPSAVAIGAVTVEAAANPIVPRDQVTSKSTVTSADLHNLPIDDLRNVLSLQPGVVESNKSKGLSIRGGRPGEAATYVDGALVRNTQRGYTPLTLGTNAVEEASITSGALSAEFGDAQSGVVSYTTRAGGQRFQGSFSYQGDDFNAWDNQGFNRFEGSFGGPIFGNLTFFVAATLQGQKASMTQIDLGGNGQLTIPGDVPFNTQNDRPIFVYGGIDTVVHQPETWDADGAPTDTALITIPRFVQYNGTCGEYGAVGEPTSQAARDIRSNYGSECQGLRTPFSAWGQNTGSAKLQYTYGSGSRLSVTGLASNEMNRNLNLGQVVVSGAASDLYNPVNYTGASSTSYAGILNWYQNLARSAERAMAVDVNLSYQVDHRINGLLTRESELNTRNPFGGFLFSPFDYLIDFNTTHTVKIGTNVYDGVHYLDDVQLRCVQAGEGACHDDVPALNNTDLISVQPYRMNPYGVSQSDRLALYTTGADQILDLSLEKRMEGRANFDWQLDRFNRIKAGGEYHTYNTARYNAANGMNSAFSLNTYHEKPIRWGGYIQDRLDLGDVVLVGGVRYDFYDSRAGFPYTPGRISSMPPIGPPPAGATQDVPVNTAEFDPYNPTAKYVPAPGHGAWSPRVQVSFPVTENTNFRLSYAHEVQVPDFDLMFRGMNTDLSMSNRNQTFGRDLDFGKTVIFEVGIRHAFGRDMVLDVSAYNKDKVSDITARLLQLEDPQQGRVDSLPGEFVRGDFRVLTNADFGNVRGVEVRLDRRFSNLFSGQISYTLQQAKNTGSDPFSYTTLLARQISAVFGTTSPPPQGIFSTDDNRTHNITGSASLQFPDDWKKGTIFGSIFRNMGAFATFRFASGLPYTLIEPAEDGLTLETRCGLECRTAEPLNTSVLPWLKNVDLRVTKGVRLGKLEWTLFAEGHNIFNFRNVIDLFVETGTVHYDKYRQKFVDEQTGTLAREAAAAAVLLPDSSVSFNDLGGCEFWQGSSANFSSGPVDCVLLERAEARWGNGDGLFEPDEYKAAFAAWYNLQNAPSRFYGTGRLLRLGAQLSF